MNKAALGLLLCSSLTVTGAAEADSNDPIHIPTHNWSSQLVGAFIVGSILEQAGNTVEYVPADSQVVYTSMCEGDIHLVHEVWQGAFGAAFEDVVDEGCVVDTQTHDAKTREGWWYPAYVEELCPGLPDWQALDECSEMFATTQTKHKGRFLAGPVDWLKQDAQRVESLGMSFEVVNADSAATLWTELESASDRKTPIVLFNWTPNFIEAIYDGNFIEFPDRPKDGYIKIGVWKGFPETWPDAYAVLQKVNFSNLDIAIMAKLIDVDEMETEDAAEKWMVDNEDRWKAWLN